MLEITKLRAGYGAINVLWDLSLSVQPGKLTTIIGPNGAGKTTLLRAITGLVPVTQGAITLDGKPLNGLPTWRMNEVSMAMIPEGRMVFRDMTVEENLMLGAFARKDKGGVAQDLERVFNLFEILRERRSQPAGTFSGGEQQMLAIGRAMMSRPKLLMLDEPSMGLSPLMMQRIMSTIVELQSEGVTILLVEQNAPAALSLANYGYVLEVGKIVLENTGEALLVDENVRKAYLGED